MKTKADDSKEKLKKRDPGFIMAEIAIKRAVQKARERTMRINTGVFVMKNGRIVEER